jgi:glycine betaine/choline ABC-type transport system substrate-binding protein
MGPGAVYGVLQRKSEFDVGVIFATDERVWAFDLMVLRDDRGFFPSYILAPVVRRAERSRAALRASDEAAPEKPPVSVARNSGSEGFT